MKTSLLIVCSLLSLTACSTVVTRYYTLTPTAVDHPVQAPAVAPTFQFEMQAVRLPVQVDQPQIVVRESTGTLAILENDRWGAPLADEFHDALTSQLETRLGARDLAGLPKATDLPVLSVQADVRRFDSLVGQYAMVDMVWSLAIRDGGQPRRTLTCSSVIKEPAGTQLADLVQAHQKVIAQLASTLATTGMAFVTNPQTVCP